MTAGPVRPPRPPRFRAGLRGLMVLVVLVALPFGWAANTIRTQRAAVAAVRATGGQVSFDWQCEVVGTGMTPWMHPITRDEPAAPRWARRWLGDELFQAIVAVDYPWDYPPESATPGIAALPTFDRLERLSLDDWRDPGVDLRPLARLRRLDHLRARGAGLDDAALAAIGRARSLRSLWIERAASTEAGFAGLGGLANLEALWLIDCPGLTDRTLARLVARLPKLRSLCLLDCPGTAATLDELARHNPGLATLTVDRCGVLDADLATIGRLAGLTTLDLGAAPITDAGLAHLGGLSRLESLRVGSPAVTDAGLAHLGGLTRLASLSLDQAPHPTDAGLGHLRRLGRLTDLDLGHARLTPEGIAALRRACPLLGRVNTVPGPAFGAWPVPPPPLLRPWTP